MNRRKFIKISSTTGLGLSVMGSSALAGVSPNSKVTVAVLGTNSRGMALARGFAKNSNVDVAYICDVDEKSIKKGLDAVKDGGQSSEPKGVKDFRRVLEDKSVDAIAMALPIHWHAPASILALSAGKHVYVEKPCSHTIEEGELLVQASGSFNRVVQMGNQRRSWPKLVEAMQLLRERVIGRIYFAKCWYASGRGSMGVGKTAQVPSSLDYDLWQGPASRRPYLDNVIHYNWHWLWHWGAGELLNNGTHFIDLARWGLDVDYPTRVTSTGGRYHWQDDQETPDTQVVTYEFPGEKSVIWEARSCNRRGVEGSGTGVSFHGTEGTLVITGTGYIVYDNDNNEVMRASSESDFNIDNDHIADFISGIQDGKKTNSNIIDANISVHICHLGNIAHRTGRAINCNANDGRIIGDTDAMKYWSKDYEPGWEPVV